jgi:hypothetical protein
MSAEKITTNTASPAPTPMTTKNASAAEGPLLAIGDTLTVVSGRIAGAWMVEDESGKVYQATAVE